MLTVDPGGPHQRVGKGIGAVRAVVARVPPLNESTAGPSDELLVAKNAPPPTFSVPEEVLSAITRVPPLGARFATRPEYMPLNTTAPRWPGNRCAADGTAQDHAGPVGRYKGAAGDWARECGYR